MLSIHVYKLSPSRHVFTYTWETERWNVCFFFFFNVIKEHSISLIYCCSWTLASHQMVFKVQIKMDCFIFNWWKRRRRNKTVSKCKWICKSTSMLWIQRKYIENDLWTIRWLSAKRWCVWLLAILSPHFIDFIYN